jgi:hypothetical protein
MANAALTYGSLYFSSSAQTTLSAATPAKAAGTTAGMENSGFTASTTNRLTYDGAVTRVFHVEACLSVGTGVGAETMTFFIYKNGSIVTGAEIDRKVTTNDVGACAVACLVSLASTDYVEVWVETLGGDNMTVEYGTLIAKVVG